MLVLSLSYIQKRGFLVCCMSVAASGVGYILTFPVAASYASRVYTGHSFRLCGKLGKVSAISSGLDCLANYTLWDVSSKKGRSRLERSLDLVRASSMVSFMVRSGRSRFALSPRLSR